MSPKGAGWPGAKGGIHSATLLYALLLPALLVANARTQTGLSPTGYAHVLCVAPVSVVLRVVEF